MSIVRRVGSRWGSWGRSGARGAVCGAPACVWGRPLLAVAGAAEGGRDRAPSSRAAPLTPWSSLGAGSGYPTQAAFSSCRRVPPALLGTRSHCHRRGGAGWASPRRGSLCMDTVSCSLGKVPWPLLFTPPHPRRAPAPAHIRARFPGNGQDWTHRAGSVRWAAGGPWIEVKVAATFGANGAGLCTVWVRGAFSSSNNRWATRGPRGWARVLVWKASLPLLWCRNCRRHIFRSHLTSECDSPRGPCHRRLTGLQPRVEMTTFGPAVASVHVEASCWTPGAGRLQWEPSRGSAPR